MRLDRSIKTSILNYIIVFICVSSPEKRKRQDLKFGTRGAHISDDFSSEKWPCLEKLVPHGHFLYWTGNGRNEQDFLWLLGISDNWIILITFTVTPHSRWKHLQRYWIYTLSSMLLKSVIITNFKMQYQYCSFSVFLDI